MSIEERIEEEARHLVQHETFDTWKSAQSMQAGGLVVVNNSFVFRDIVKTTKAEDYVALRVLDSENLEFPPVIVSGLRRLNADFKYIPPAAAQPTTRSLKSAVSKGMKALGEFLFVLIGEIDDSRVLAQSIGHADYDEMVWRPALKNAVQVSGRRIEVGQVHDEDLVWAAIERHYADSGEAVPEGLREPIGVALDKLQQEAIADLAIPPAGETPGPGTGVTDQIVAVLSDQMGQYDEALKRLQQASGDTTALNEVLRLAYNFASDATGYLALIVSVCDLKPLVLWGTVSRHFALAEAFRGLPWTRSRNKPSMKNYVGTISDARNSAFHNLFPFRKSLSVRLTKGALADAELVLFSEHGRRKENELLYPDKPLVDVLVSFTRARERRVTPRFWRQNREVMHAAIDLFAATSEFVRQLHAAR